jgi:hypothetical protein
MRTWSLLVALLALLLPGLPALAQAPPADPLTKPSTARLSGEAWFGLFRRGKSLGTLNVRITKGVRSEIEVRVVARFKLAKKALRLEESTTLAADLTLERCVQIQQEGTQPPERVEVTRSGKVYKVSVRQGEEKPEVSTCKPSRRLVFGIAQRYVLARACDPTTGKVASLSQLVPGEEEALSLELSARPIPEQKRLFVVRISPPETSPRKTQGWRYRRRGSRVEAMVALDHGGLVFSAAKDEAEAKRDRPVPVIDPASPRGVVLKALKALLAGDAKAAEAAFDWARLYKSLEGEGGLKAWKALFLERLSGMPREFQADGNLEESLAKASVEVVGKAKRRVSVPGEGLRFVLERRGTGPWRVVDFD